MLSMFERLGSHERIMSLSSAIDHICLEENAVPGPIPSTSIRPPEETTQIPRPWFHVKTELIERTGEYNQHYLVPISALLKAGESVPEETIIKKVALHSKRWEFGVLTDRIIMIFVQEPLVYWEHRRTTKPTRTMPPSLAKWMFGPGVTTEQTEGMRVYRQQVHRNKRHQRHRS